MWKTSFLFKYPLKNKLSMTLSVYKIKSEFKYVIINTTRFMNSAYNEKTVWLT